MPSIRIVAADDHPIFREGLIRLLETRSDFRVVGTASDGDDAVKLVAELEPDLLLLDLAMPRMTGLEALQKLQGTATCARIILLTATIDTPEIIKALEVGAQGVVLKESTSDLLFTSIRAVMAGEYWVGRKRVGDLVSALRELSAVHPQPTRQKFGLTPRELEIIDTIVCGYGNSYIAAKLSISEKTVKHHLTNIFDKLGVFNRLELALFALHHGLTPTASASASPAADSPSSQSRASA